MQKMHLITSCCEKSLAKLSLPLEMLPVCKRHSFFSLMSKRHITNFKFTCHSAQKDAKRFCWHVLHKVAWIHTHLGADKTLLLCFFLCVLVTV